MAFRFLITEGAQGDIRTCRAEDPEAAAEIVALLREVVDNPSIAAILVDTRYEGDEVIESVDGIWRLQHKRFNLYRVKLVDVRRWRIITAVDHQTKQIAAMGIMSRDVDYDENHPLFQRITGEYDRIGFSRY